MKIQSPCMMCFNHGVVYSPERCRDCEYELAMKFLKKSLIYLGCETYCTQGYEKDYCYHCDENCKNHEKFVVDWDKAFQKLPDFEVKE